MSIEIVVALIIVLLIGQGIVLFFVLKPKPALAPEKDDSAESAANLLLLQRLEGLERSLDSRMSESSRAMYDAMSAQNTSVRQQGTETAQLIREITQEITSVKEIGRQTQGFAEQLQSLQDVLKNPKQRGILGEYYLETVLKNVLPPGMYKMQHPFKNGEIVDAAVFVNDKIVPIDSKFSLDNYNRYASSRDDAERTLHERAFVNDLKLRITETAKYIRPEEGTMDFAFMFIPSEGIYYELLVNTIGSGGLDGEDENLIQRAASKYKVIIVSPTSFLAYLQTVMQGLRALQIEQKAEIIQKRVGELGKHLGAYDSYFKKLGGALGVTVSHFNSANKELTKIDKDVFRITGEAVGIEAETIEKPALLELD
jgi:DNA recombination protein RmuC